MNESDVSDILEDMDEYLDEPLPDDDVLGPSPAKQGKVSNVTPQPSDSFHYKAFPAADAKTDTGSDEFKTPKKIAMSPRKSTDLPTHVVDGESILPLTHTVSFYRRQQNQVSCVE